MRNIKLVLEYDGSRYDGWQRQKNTRNTIQGTLEELLSQCLGEKIEVQGSGRTDAGVHALEQVSNFHTTSQISCQELMDQLHQCLPEDIGILSAEEVNPHFHSRLNATGKTYEYRIWNSDRHRVFKRKYEYHYPDHLDVDTMQEAASYLIGEHDFQNFSSGRGSRKSTIRTITDIAIHQSGSQIQIQYQANGFLYNMVRILTGTLLEVGTGFRLPQDIPSIFQASTRESAGFTAPPHALFLKNVSYESQHNPSPQPIQSQTD